MSAIEPIALLAPAPLRARRSHVHLVRSVDCGTTLFRERDAATRLFEVASGTLRLTRVLETGRRQVVAFAQKGDVVGFPARGTHQADCDALTDATVILHRLSSLEGDEADSELRRRLLAAAMDQITRLQDHLLLLARKGAAGKLASFLADLADRQGVPEFDGVAIDMILPRSDIADYLCTSTETISRTLTRMCEAGLIRRDGISRLVVTDSAGLDAMACAD